MVEYIKMSHKEVRQGFVARKNLDKTYNILLILNFQFRHHLLSGLLRGKAFLKSSPRGRPEKLFRPCAFKGESRSCDRKIDRRNNRGSPALGTPLDGQPSHNGQEGRFPRIPGPLPRFLRRSEPAWVLLKLILGRGGPRYAIPINQPSHEISCLNLNANSAWGA